MHLHQGPDQEALYHYGEMLKQRKKKKAQLPMGFEPTNSRLEGRCSNRCATTTTAQVILHLMYEGFGQC